MILTVIGVGIVIAGILSFLFSWPRWIAENLKEPLMGLYSIFVSREKLEASYDPRGFELGMPLALIFFGLMLLI
jgi:hypothetical protein